MSGPPNGSTICWQPPIFWYFVFRYSTRARRQNPQRASEGPETLARRSGTGNAGPTRERGTGNTSPTHKRGTGNTSPTREQYVVVVICIYSFRHVHCCYPWYSSRPSPLRPRPRSSRPRPGSPVDAHPARQPDYPGGRLCYCSVTRSRVRIAILIWNGIGNRIWIGVRSGIWIGGWVWISIAGFGV